MIGKAVTEMLQLQVLYNVYRKIMVENLDTTTSIKLDIHPTQKLTYKDILALSVSFLLSLGMNAARVRTTAES